MGYYKDRFTNWTIERDPDLGTPPLKFKPRPVAPAEPAEKKHFCKAQMIDAAGFDWGSALVGARWQYEKYQAENPTWTFFDF